MNPITSPNQIRVGLRFFNSGNNFNGEHNTYIGTPNGDLGGQGMETSFRDLPVPAGSTYNDIRVSMNIFGDDDWNNGPVLFDNFVVINGTNTVPVANAFTMGTVTNLSVTRSAVTADQAGGIIESDGILVLPAVSYLSQPTNGTATANGSSLTYTANNGYTGTDSFNFGVGDGIGGLSLGTEPVQVNSNAGLNRFTNTIGSAAVFSGAPFCDYILLMTSSLTPPVVWTPVSTNSANGSGLVNFTEPQTGSMGFMRTKLQP